LAHAGIKWVFAAAAFDPGHAHSPIVRPLNMTKITKKVVSSATSSKSHFDSATKGHQSEEKPGDSKNIYRVCAYLICSSTCRADIYLKVDEVPESFRDT